jgi:peptidoglycan/LPS O-acetylase OafA/YrhL
VAQYPLCKAILGREFALAVILACMAALLWIDNSDVSFVILTMPLLICLYYNGKASAALFGNRLVHHLGVISYSLYLVHPLFRGPANALENFAREHGGPTITGLYILLAVASSWAAAYLSQRFIEARGQRLLNPVRPHG